MLEGRQTSSHRASRIKFFRPLLRLPGCLVGNCLLTHIQISEARRTLDALGVVVLPTPLLPSPSPLYPLGNPLGKNKDQSSSSNEISSEAEVIVFISSQAERC